MKRKTKLITALTLSALSVLTLGTACGETTSGVLGEKYEYLFDKPYAATPDENIQVDGYLEDEIWENKSWIEQTLGDASWKATTHFTPKGLYIAVEATDNTMSYKNRYTDRSAFNVYVAKEGTETIEINGLGYYKTEVQQFILDPYYCRSKDRIPYYYEAQFTGELNSETECTMTGELFLAWSDLYYTQEELGEQGYPDTIQMYVNYEGEGNEVLGSCLWRQETYFHYDTNGLINKLAHQDFGDANGGLAATDQWEINENGNIQTTAGRTQIAWLKNAHAKNFMFEAELKPLGNRTNAAGQVETISLRGERVVGRFGLISARNVRADFVTTVSGYSIYAADARSICDNVAGGKSVSLTTYRQTDSFHWANLVGMSKKVQTGYQDDTLTLRIIKDGDNFHYFYGDNYWASERNSNLQEQVYCGIFTSQGVEVVDYKFVDYGNDSAAIQEQLKEYMYFIETAGAMTRGSVLTSNYAIPKGQPVTISFSPEKGNLLTDIKIGTTAQNAESKFDEIYPLLNENNEYTFVPESDMYIGGTFTSFPKTSLVKVRVEFTDDSGAKVMDANYEVRGNEKRMYYKGKPNSAGHVLIDLPVKGDWQVGSEMINVSGDYALRATFKNHHAVELTFTLDDTIELEEKTNQYVVKAQVSTNAWGTVVVNGKSVTSSGSPMYNEETGNYYTEGSVKAYFKNTVATTYAATVELQMTKSNNRNGDLIGLAITDGTDLLLIKYNLENNGKVIICAANETKETSPGVEYAITGFNYTNLQEPYGEGRNGRGTLTMTIVKCGSAIYLYNKDGVMKAYFNKEGVHLVNDSAFSWGASAANISAINDDVKALFSNGEKTQTALGFFTYMGSDSMRSEFKLNFSTNIDAYKESIGYNALNITLPAGQELDTENYPVRAHYAMGESVKLGVLVEDAKNKKMQLVIQDKTGVKMVDGVYDFATKAMTFEFIFSGNATVLSTTLYSAGDMSWSKEWGEFVPDRDNTMAEESQDGTLSGTKLYLALPEGQSLDTVNFPVKQSYETGETVKIGVKVENAGGYKLQLIITDANGTRKIDGSYDQAKGCFVFEFTATAGEIYATTIAVEYGDMEWREEWGEFVPDRENTKI